MDNFIVSARKYRPATFDTVVGQQHITGTLKNAIKNNQLAQAFLFCGPRGVGKTTCARILAKTINCERLSDETEACGTCGSCESFAQGTSFTIHELDAASNNSVDDIRTLIEQVRIPPQVGRYKIYIIDEVHMLSQAAFNAFLKTLEEPPSYAIFILATTEKHKILPTILSRCQIFDFNRIQVSDMADHLANIATKEGVTYDTDGLHIIAQKADGGLRDALSMFDQIVSFSNKQVSYQAVIDNLNILDYDYYFRVVDAIVEEDTSSALLVLDDILAHGFDGGHFIVGLSSHLRNLLVTRDEKTLRLLDVSETIRQRYQEQAKKLNAGVILSALNIANQCEVNYRMSKNHRLQVELALLKMCHIASALQLAREGGGQISALEKKKPSPALNTVPPKEATEPAANPPVSEERPIAVASAEPPPASQPAEPKPVPPPVKKPASSWSNAKLGAAIPDLGKIFDKPEEEEASDEPTLLEGNEYRDFTFDEFLAVWHGYADKLKKDNKINLYTVMTANAPRLGADFQVEITVENQIQEDLLTMERIEIVNELRPKLRNYRINLVAKRMATDTVRKPYTAQEKYQAMAAKNPLLDKLRQEFNLGLE